MVAINGLSLVFIGWSLYMWLLDSLLNSILARRLGDGRSAVYFIPLYGYYRFGMLLGLPYFWVIVVIALATVAIVALPQMFFVAHPDKYVIVLAGMIANAAINGLAATRLKRSKWIYIAGSVLFELITVFLEPVSAIVFLKTDSFLNMFYVLLVLATFRQIAKIVLILRTTKSLEVQPPNLSDS